jgi:hypothetical protein
MVRFLADENFNNQIVRGVLRQNSDVDDELSCPGRLGDRGDYLDCGVQS